MICPLQRVKSATQKFLVSLAGLEYAHCKGVAHCDVKLDNILVGLDGHIRICDWSSALVTSADNTNASSRNFFCNYLRGTKMYAPPEVITQNIVSEGMLIAKKPWDTTLGDVWSTGITIYTMAVGRPPFHYAHPRDPWFASFLRETHQEDDMTELISECLQLHERSESLEKEDSSTSCDNSVSNSKRRFSWPSDMNVSLVFLLSKMLHVKPEKRCTVSGALQELKRMKFVLVNDTSETGKVGANLANLAHPIDQAVVS